jgi:D-alanyl-lipoteichoic acid acyltransferase DltB (MBOAT superfamily)
LPLLLGSILANLAVAWAFRRLQWGAIIGFGVVFNLALLGVFKYADFAAGIGASLTGAQHVAWNIVLPLGISFFTFEQISYLVDLRKRSTPLYGARDFGLFVTFFPHLIAGPIVRHHELLPQFAQDPLRDGLDERIARGLALLVIGLVKKLFIADQLGRIADPVYAIAARGEAVPVLDGWGGAFAFYLQVYFDFSAYSDMAIGAALLLGFTLPLNFDSPYKATSIRDFWRRWHMTLTRFMRDYLYVPIGLRLNRRFPEARAVNESVTTVITMVLIGLWHGANWTFVVFGLAHGLALVVDQLWSRRGLVLPSLLGWAATALFVCLSTVLFRAPDLTTAGRVFAGMVGLGAPGGRLVGLSDGLLLAAAAAIAFRAPNSQTLALERLRPGRFVAAAIAAALVLAVIEAGSKLEVPFVYFQF